MTNLWNSNEEVIISIVTSVASSELLRFVSPITHLVFIDIYPDSRTSYPSPGISTQYSTKHTSATSNMDQGDPATPSPKNKESNPLESRFASRSKATSGFIRETARPQKQGEASGSSSGKHTISHAIKSLLPHSTLPALGKKPKNNPRSPLPIPFQGQTADPAPALTSMSEHELMEGHVFHSRQAHAYLEELVRRRHPAPPAWRPPKNWQVSQASEQPTLSTDADQPRLRDVGSLASIDEESSLAGPSQQIRKDSAFTQGVRRNIASAGRRPTSKIVSTTRTAGLATIHVIQNLTIMLT